MIKIFQDQVRPFQEEMTEVWKHPLSYPPTAGSQTEHPSAEGMMSGCTYIAASPGSPGQVALLQALSDLPHNAPLFSEIKSILFR